MAALQRWSSAASKASRSFSNFTNMASFRAVIDAKKQLKPKPHKPDKMSNIAAGQPKTPNAIVTVTKAISTKRATQAEIFLHVDSFIIFALPMQCIPTVSSEVARLEMAKIQPVIMIGVFTSIPTKQPIAKLAAGRKMKRLLNDTQFFTDELDT